jgi:hypothetical protein
MFGDTALSILRRLMDPDEGKLTPAAAEAILQIHFTDADQVRMSELAARSNQGILKTDEASEYDGYIAAADLLSLWKSKARISLQKQTSAA